MKTPAIWNADNMFGRGQYPCQAGLPDGRWVLARPEPFYTLTQRWKAAWLVFTGKADALTWTGQ